MPLFLGIDTSNYTTSLALYDSACGAFRAAGRLLPVKEGALGLRQSDAVFAHIKQLGEVWENLGKIDQPLSAVGASVTPRTEEGSYMPCFLVGKTVGESISSANAIPFHGFSHQQGHLAAAIRGAEVDELFSRPFLAFHVSGGTTDLLFVEHKPLLNAKLVGGSKDLKAGQLVDRVGNLLGLTFPAGPALEALAKQYDRPVKGFRTSVEGLWCHLSGGYNLAEKRLKETGAEETAAFTLAFVAKHLIALTKQAREVYGDLPVLFAGGVMSNSLIRKEMEAAFDGVYFAPPAWSADNARGIALLTAMKEGCL
ncbi:MAG: peptidase M22 [Oscillospiraceae bacterium]|nr:peptidase M22 [Oscillospiraceae bacterium]